LAPEKSPEFKQTHALSARISSQHHQNDLPARQDYLQNIALASSEKPRKSRVEIYSKGI